MAVKPIPSFDGLVASAVRCGIDKIKYHNDLFKDTQGRETSCKGMPLSLMDEEDDK